MLTEWRFYTGAAAPEVGQVSVQVGGAGPDEGVNHSIVHFHRSPTFIKLMRTSWLLDEPEGVAEVGRERVFGGGDVAVARIGQMLRIKAALEATRQGRRSPGP